jgi:hypothetical protein
MIGPDTNGSPFSFRSDQCLKSQWTGQYCKFLVFAYSLILYMGCCVFDHSGRPFQSVKHTAFRFGVFVFVISAVREGIMRFVFSNFVVFERTERRKRVKVANKAFCYLGLLGFYDKSLNNSLGANLIIYG